MSKVGHLTMHELCDLQSSLSSVWGFTEEPLPQTTHVEQLLSQVCVFHMMHLEHTNNTQSKSILRPNCCSQITRNIVFAHTDLLRSDYSTYRHHTALIVLWMLDNYRIWKYLLIQDSDANKHNNRTFWQEGSLKVMNKRFFQ